MPVLTAVAPEQANLRRGATWEMRLQRATIAGTREVPTHIILDGIGHPMRGNGTVQIGSPARTNLDLALPAPFKAAPDCLVQLIRDDGRLWLDDALLSEGGTTVPGFAGRLPVEAGDRMIVRVGEIGVELLFATCRTGRAQKQSP